MNCADMILDLEDKSMDIVHNNATHIFNVVMHNLIMDRHTLLPSPCYMLFETYAYHTE